MKNIFDLFVEGDWVGGMSDLPVCVNASPMRQFLLALLHSSRWLLNRFEFRLVLVLNLCGIICESIFFFDCLQSSNTCGDLIG